MDAATTNTTGSIPHVQDWVRKSGASYDPSHACATILGKLPYPLVLLKIDNCNWKMIIPTGIRDDSLQSSLASEANCDV
jgi:hypothetical protein